MNNATVKESSIIIDNVCFLIFQCVPQIPSISARSMLCKLHKGYETYGETKLAQRLEEYSDEFNSLILEILNGNSGANKSLIELVSYISA